MMKLVNGELVDMTPEEIAARQAEEIEWQSGQVDRHNDQTRKDRVLAYNSESDPIFFKWQRGEATEQEWLDKIQEIKQRYVYQGE